MAQLLLSEAERVFIYHGVQDDIRCDGRHCKDYRPMELETEFLPNTGGSARVRIDTTDILVGVHVDLVSPSDVAPKQGKFQFHVQCSANATPAFEGRGGEKLAVELVNVLTQIYNHDGALNLEALSVIEGEKCWMLNVDIMILECGGNLFDTISIAVKAALFNTKVPCVTVAITEGGLNEIDISDDPYNCNRLDVTKSPCAITLSRIGKKHIIDATMEEEACSLASVIVGVNIDGDITGLYMTGSGSLHTDNLQAMIQSAKQVGQELNQALMSSLMQEEKLIDTSETCGFLR